MNGGWTKLRTQRQLIASVAVSYLVLTSGMIGIGCRPTPPLQDAGTAAVPKSKWGDPNKFTQNSIQHQSLPEGQMKRIRSLQATFQEVDPTPLEKWIEDFRRDTDPEREIRICEGMAKAYKTYCGGRKLTPEAKRDVYQIVILRSGAPDNEVLTHLNLKTLSPDDAKKVLSGYKMAPAPVLVMKQ